MALRTHYRRWRLRPRPPRHVCFDQGFQKGRLYQLIYTTASAPVLGLGFAALRDCVSWFKYGADAVAPPIVIRHAYAYGRSQTGRWLRTYVHSFFKPDYVICDAAYSDARLRSEIRWQYHAQPIIDPNRAHKKAFAKTAKTAEWKAIFSRRTAAERLNSRLKGQRRLNAVRVRGRMKVAIHALLSIVVHQVTALAMESRWQVSKAA